MFQRILSLKMVANTFFATFHGALAVHRLQPTMNRARKVQPPPRFLPEGVVHNIFIVLECYCDFRPVNGSQNVFLGLARACLVPSPN